MGKIFKQMWMRPTIPQGSDVDFGEKQMESRDWYVLLSGVVAGPYDASDVKRMGENGTIRPQDYVRKGKDGKWIIATKVKGLFPDDAKAIPAESNAEKPKQNDPPLKQVDTKPEPQPPSLVQTAEPKPIVSSERPAIPTKQEDQQTTQNPNLQECPDCGKMVSKKATQCPHCGRPLKGKEVEARLTVGRAVSQNGILFPIKVTVDGKELFSLKVGEKGSC
jgi:hypothetical protein